MSCIMDKNEIITLSSDDESDCTNRLEHNENSTMLVFKNTDAFLKTHVAKIKDTIITKNVNVNNKCHKNEVRILKLPKVPEKKCEKNSKEKPELVDLVECVDKPNINSNAQCQNTKHNSAEIVQNHSKLDVINIDEGPIYPLSDKKIDMCDSTEKKDPKILCNLSNTEVIKDNATDVPVNSTSKLPKTTNEFQGELNKIKADEGNGESLQFFTEFVEFCGSLENVPHDRARLTKKLMKRYGEADSSYIKSQEFRNLIQQSRNKISTNNLYLVAKKITDELRYSKKIETDAGKSVQSQKTEETSQRGQQSVGNNETVQECSSRRSKKRTKIINQIIKKLDNLGNRIRELEEKEVDLSDEEESSYVQLQRYRERFCQIYSKLCKYTNEVADANLIYNSKITFVESKYPSINKCIENWLNKTKSFPDFSDILKLIESQSSSLGLQSNRELIRSIAIEIFQKVGALLKRRRVYDLWNSFCEFLDMGEDPANTDPTLDQMLKSNFEIRVKKEQEIFQHFTELQEKQRLKPEEISDEEANRSPVDSECEDDKELEHIENTMNKKLDDAIKKETEGNDDILGNMDWDGGDTNSNNETKSVKLDDIIRKSKESKNNFRNCKSLKWRLGSGGTNTSFSANSEDSNTGTEQEKEKKSDKDDSDLELIIVEDFKSGTGEIRDKIKTKEESCLPPSKRPISSENEDPVPKKIKYSKNAEHFDGFVFSGKNDNLKEKTDEVFNVQCCQIFTDNIFEDIYEKRKSWGKRKVFRDLTNVSRLMDIHGKKKKMPGLYSFSFFHRRAFRLEKSSWKNRFKVNFKMVGSKDQKCALNQGGKSRKTLNSDSGKATDEKDIHNNSQNEKDYKRNSFCSGHGNGSEEDNNGDKNKKNGQSGEGINDNQFEEEDEDEEENEAEKDESKLEDEAVKDSFPKKKTEKQPNANTGRKTPLRKESSQNKKLKAMQLSTEKLENKNEDERKSDEFLSAKEIVAGIQKIPETFDISEENVESTTEIKEISKSEKDGKKIINLKMENKSKKREFKLKTGQKRCSEVQESKIVSQKIEREVADAKIEQVSPGQCLVKTRCENHRSTTLDNRQESMSCKTAGKTGDKSKTAAVPNENKYKKFQTIQLDSTAQKSETPWKYNQLCLSSHKFQKRNTPSPSDEERVKRFLMHSPSSISITPPRKLSLSKPPSQAALQALATLRNLKDISATIVRRKPKSEDDVVVIGGSYKRNEDQNSSLTDQNSNLAERRRSDLPVISSVQSIDSTTPKIVTVEGNVSGFENSWPEAPERRNSESDSSSIRISNVWGSSDSFIPPAPKNGPEAAGCSSRQSDPSPSCSFKKKSSKKKVELVVLDE